MSHNTFGHLFRVTTWGESHGPALGCVVDGCPPGHSADRGRHPGLARQAAAGAGQVRHPAPGAGRGEDPLRRVRGRAHRRPGDHRHADLDDHRERRPALARLFARSPTRSGPATPTTPTSPSTACATIAAAVASRRARRRRGSRPAPSRARCWARASIVRGGAGPDRSARGRPRRAGTGTRSDEQPVLVPGRGDGRGLGGAPGRRSARPARRPAPSSRSRRPGVPAGWGAPIYGKLDAELAGGADVDQRRQGRRDRRRLRRRGALGRGERRRDA